MTHSKFINHKLYPSYRDIQPLEKDTFPKDISLEEAYTMQHSFTAVKEKNGEKLQGYKISMTSPETQALFGASEPLYGQLTNKRVRDRLSLSKDTANALIELELIFIIKEELTAEDSLEDILQKTKVAPGLEIPDSRFLDWFPKMPKEQVCADGAVGGYVSYGEAKDATYEDLDNIQGKLVYNGQILAQDSSKTVMGHPVKAMEWLLKKLGEHGLSLQPGMFVSSGTFVMPKELAAGTYKGEFDYFGTVILTITE
ncbi:2-keto-4-pentenoate hydratase [Carnobacterium sp. FSL W8-0810]|uniref:2-keto-4-pentenoate hydratase n=1 Tax=Carnobacterium sp. FSL W8-0810 TaxID=2954705 RepID=UPI0030FB2D2E